MSDDGTPKALEKVAQETGFIGLMREALRRWDAIVTRAVGTPKGELFMSLGHLFQGARNHDFLRQLARELEHLRRKGDIADDYEGTEQAKACFQELLAALEDPPVDEVKFNALKSLFIAAALEGKSTREDVLPQQLLAIAGKMESGEVLLLAAVYSLVQDGSADKMMTATDGTLIRARKWLKPVLERSGFGVIQIVEHYEDRLIEKRLLSPRNKHGVDMGKRVRLTELGHLLSQFIAEGDKAVADVAAESG